jgi:thioredoxin-related protein
MIKALLTFIFLFSFTYAQNLSVNEALEIAKKQEKNLLVFIYSDYCYYCESMEEDTLEDDEVKEYLNKRFILLKINQNEKERLRDDLETGFVPITYVISYEDGEILLELPGRKDKKTFISIIKDTLLE